MAEVREIMGDAEGNAVVFDDLADAGSQLLCTLDRPSIREVPRRARGEVREHSGTIA